MAKGKGKVVAETAEQIAEQEYNALWKELRTPKTPTPETSTIVSPVVETSTPSIPQAQEPVQEDVQEINLVNHPNYEVRELANRIEALKGGIGAIKADGMLTDVQKSARINEAETQIKAATQNMRDKLFMLAVNGDISVFLNAIEARAGRMFKGDVFKIADLCKLADAPSANKTLQQQIEESIDTISDAKSKIVQLNDVIKQEQIAQIKLMEQEFVNNPVKVMMLYPERQMELTGKQYYTPAGQKAQPARQRTPNEISLGDREGVSDADHSLMLSAVTKSSVGDAIASGIDPNSNADIAAWIAEHVLGSVGMRVRHGIHTKIYNIRAQLEKERAERGY